LLLGIRSIAREESNRAIHQEALARRDRVFLSGNNFVLLAYEVRNVAVIDEVVLIP